MSLQTILEINSWILYISIALLIYLLVFWIHKYLLFDELRFYYAREEAEEHDDELKGENKNTITLHEIISKIKIQEQQNDGDSFFQVKYRYPFFFGWNTHFQTVVSSLPSTLPPYIEYERATLQDPSNDQNLLYFDFYVPKETNQIKNVIILIPGICGHSKANYIISLVKYLVQTKRTNFAVAIWNRPAIVTPITHHKVQYMGNEKSVEAFVHFVKQKFDSLVPHAQIYYFGLAYSLGGHNLLRYLGLSGKNTPLHAALTFCQPYHSGKSADALQKYPLYDKVFVKGLMQIIDNNKKIFDNLQIEMRAKQSDFSLEKVYASKTIREYDNALTKYLIEAQDIETEYYGRYAIKDEHVEGVAIPTLLFHALDDIVVPKDSIPFRAIRNNSHVGICTTNHGGHCGFLNAGGLLHLGIHSFSFMDQFAVAYFEAFNLAMKKQE